MRSIKTKLFSLAMAVSMVLALAGCAMSAPSTVGSIGGVEIPAGIYLLARCCGAGHRRDRVRRQGRAEGHLHRHDQRRGCHRRRQ